MDYDGIQRAVAHSKEVPRKVNALEQMHIFALRGLLEYFKRGECSKEDASRMKATLRDAFEKEQRRNANAAAVSALQDKIRLAVLLNANPYVLFVQACKCISLLVNDNGFFFEQVQDDCRGIAECKFEELPEGEETRLRENIVRLQRKMHSNDDADSIHRLSRAIEAMQARLEFLQEGKDKK